MRTFLALVILICIGMTSVHAQLVSQETVLEDGQGIGLKNNRSIPDGYGGFYLAGNQDNGRGFLLHLDSSFAVLSSTLYSGGAWPNVFPDMIFDDIERLSNGELVICGQVTDTTTGKVNALLMQCDSSGTVLWARLLNGTGLYSRFASVSSCPGGGFICTGNLFNPITTQPGQLLLTRTDSAGQALWSKAFTGLNHENSGREVVVLPDGGFLLTGFTENLNPFEGSALLMRLDSAGNLLQSVRIQVNNAVPIAYCAGSDLVNTPNGPILYLSTSTGVALASLDSAFQTLQVRSYTSSGPGGGFSSTVNSGFHVIQSSDGGGIFTTRNSFASDITKIDSAGNLEWSRVSYMQLNDLHLQNDGSMVLIGDGPLFGLNPPGDEQKQLSMLPQIGLQRTDSLALSGNCVLSGTTTYDPTNPVYSIVPFLVSGISAGTMQVFSVSTTQTSVLTRSGCVDILGGGEELSSGTSVRIFPNPASEKFSIEHSLQGIVRMTLTDAHGRKVQQVENILSGKDNWLDAPLPGAYLIILDNGKEKVTCRLLVIR